MNKSCYFCGVNESESKFDLLEEGYYEDMLICHECWFSDTARRWRLKQEEKDQAYKLHSELVTAGFPVDCEHCGHRSFRHPKYIGHSPDWEVMCDFCHRFKWDIVKPRKHDLTKWHEFYQAYMKGRLNLQANQKQLQDMSGQLGLPEISCECGGHYSMLAKPRCERCNHVLSDSLFHVFDQHYQDN